MVLNLLITRSVLNAKMREKMNVIMIISHDTGKHLGCYGKRVETPNLNKIAKDGVIFTNFFCTAPQCSPSRASLLTGRYPHNHGLIGLTHRGFRLNRDEILLLPILAGNGYLTCFFGFQHESTNPYALGYQKVFKPKTNSCIDVVPVLLDFLRNKPKSPFFLMVGFSETHRPFPRYEGPVEKIEPLPYLPDEPDVRKDVEGLNMLIRRMDKSVGLILNAIEELGLDENTLLIYTTDHGIAFPGAKATLFDPGIEIALLMRGPEPFQGGKKIDALLSNIDLMPTILEICGAPVPSSVQGKSVLSLLRGEKTKLHQEIYFELTYHVAYDPMRGVRDERYKYIRSFEWRPFWFPPNVDPGLSKEVARIHGYFDKPRPAEMLFDLHKDPYERMNLAGDPSYLDVLKDMRSKLYLWMKNTGDPLLVQGYVPPPPGAVVTPPRSYEPHDLDPFPYS
ncbi:MAG TPA: sulfatase [Candidatus Bathyarchaeota archaeon]|nr:sulfatase [Candidatus Bathyarchaeota archaeon]